MSHKERKTSIMPRLGNRTFQNLESEMQAYTNRNRGTWRTVPKKLLVYLQEVGVTTRIFPNQKN